MMAPTALQNMITKVKFVPGITQLAEYPRPGGGSWIPRNCREQRNQGQRDNR